MLSKLWLPLLAAAFCACTDSENGQGARPFVEPPRVELASVDDASATEIGQTAAPPQAYRLLGSQIQADVRQVSLPGSLTFRVGPVPGDAWLSFGYSTTPVRDPTATLDLDVTVTSHAGETSVFRTAISNIAHRPRPKIEHVRTQPESEKPERLVDGRFGEAWRAPRAGANMIQIDLAEPTPLTAFSLATGVGREGVPARLHVALSSDGSNFDRKLNLDRSEYGDHVWHVLPGEPVRSLRIWVIKTHDGQAPKIEEIVLATEPNLRRLPDQLGRWSNQSIDVSAYEGETILVSFRFGPLSSGEDSRARGLVGGPRIDLARKEGELNVVLISIDTVRVDRLSAFGYERPTSPFLDQLVETPGAVRFTNVRSTSTWTPPSHLAMMAGRTPFQLNVHASRSRIIDKTLVALDASVPTLASILRSHGYKTFALASAGGTNGQLGLRNGFEVYDQPWNMMAAQPLDHFGELVSRTQRARQWLETNRSRKFFLFLHTYAAHAPYKRVDFLGCEDSEANAKRCQKYLDRLYMADNRLRRGLEWGPRAKKYLEAGVHDPDKMSALYDGGLLLVDEFLRQVMETLDRLDLRRDTLVVITSDHGEPFAEHHREQFDGGHGRGLYDEYLRVPLVFLVPGLDTTVRSDVSASLVDIPPTVLDLLGIETSARFEGHSLAPVVRGEESDLDLRPIFYEVLAEEKFEDFHFIAASKKDRKILANQYDLFDGRHELYDLAADPAEKHDIAKEQPAIADDLLAEIDRHLAGAFRGMIVVDISTLGRPGTLGLHGTATFDRPVRLFEIATRGKTEFVKPKKRGDSKHYEIKLMLRNGRRLIGFRPESEEVQLTLDLRSDHLCMISTPTSERELNDGSLTVAASEVAVPALALQAELPRGSCSIRVSYVAPTAGAGAAPPSLDTGQIEDEDRERILEQMRALGYID